MDNTYRSTTMNGSVEIHTDGQTRWFVAVIFWHSASVCSVWLTQCTAKSALKSSTVLVIVMKTVYCEVGTGFFFNEMSRRSWFEPVLFRFRFMVDGVLLREGVLGVPSVAPVSSFHPWQATPSKRTNGKAWKPSKKKIDAVSKIGELKNSTFKWNTVV